MNKVPHTPIQNGLLDRESTADSVVNIIRQRIILGEYNPGERLIVDEIAKELGVSPTPVREAVRTLQAEYLLHIQPYRGAKVNGLPIEELEEIYDLRRCLEAYAARKAAQKYTPDDIGRLEDLLNRLCESNHSYPHGEYWELHREFHRTLIAPASSTGWLQRYLELLWQSTERYRALYAVGILSFNEVHKQHQELVSAARDRNGDLLAKLFHSHINAVEKTVLSGYEQAMVGNVKP